MEFFENLGTGDHLTVYNIVGPLLIVLLVAGTVAIHLGFGSIAATVREQFITAFLRGWRFGWRLLMAPIIGTYREVTAAYRQFREPRNPANTWSDGLQNSALKGSGTAQSDSVEQIRKGREGRERRD